MVSNSGVQPGVTVQRRGVDHREIQLLVGRAQPVEQVEGTVQHPVRPGAGPVHLVDDHDGFETHGEGFLGDETGLRHRPVHRVHQQQHRIHHGQHPLDLAAEIGVAGRVHDVDAVIAPAQGGVFGQDGDAALLLQVVGVHDPFHRGAPVAERAGLLQEFVHQRGLAVVYVGDDGDVAELFDHCAFYRAETGGGIIAGTRVNPPDVVRRGKNRRRK